MNAELKQFAIEWLRVAAATLVPVVLTAFMAMPQALGRHPGEPCVSGACTELQRHMT